MLAWVDREALEATLATGEVHFHSRSRDRLWRKGETSGNVLRLSRSPLDCDADALLLTVDPAGPTCHRGTRSCFDLRGGAGDRASADPGVRLARDALDDDRRTGGDAACRLVYREACSPAASMRSARKVTEEATEVLMAAKDDAVAESRGDASARTAARTALGAEAADLLFHTLVLLAERGLEPAAVLDVLRERRGRAYDAGVTLTIRYAFLPLRRTR